MSAFQRFRETFWTPQAALYFAIVGVTLAAAGGAVLAVDLNPALAILVGLSLGGFYDVLADYLTDIQQREQASDVDV